MLFVDINKDSIQGSSNFTCRTASMFEQTILDSIKAFKHEGDDEEDFEISGDHLFWIRLSKYKST